jgi:HEAT repeat protein
VGSRLVAALVVLGLAAAAGAGWHFYGRDDSAATAELSEEADADWLMDLHSANPQVAEGAEAHVKELGAAALPEIQSALRDTDSDTATKKAAMKAAGLLGPIAAPAIPAVAEQLAEPGLTADAAVALSYLGRDAFQPLRDALSSDDPVVRSEALRSLGKLRERAPLESRVVIPLLLKGLRDPDPRVRIVGATYLGIIGQDSEGAVDALIAALKDQDEDVRIAAATALGSFPGQAKVVIPALRKATADANPDVAREAGVAIVKLQGSGSD